MAPEVTLRRQAPPKGERANYTAIAVRLSARNIVTTGVMQRMTVPAISTTDSMALASAFLFISPPPDRVAQCFGLPEASFPVTTAVVLTIG